MNAKGLLLVLAFFLMGCSVTQSPPVVTPAPSTEIPTIKPPATPTLIPSPTIMASPTPMLNPTELLSQLPKGQYLLINTWSEQNEYLLLVFTTEAKLVSQISIDLSVVSTSTDGKRLTFFPDYGDFSFRQGAPNRLKAPYYINLNDFSIHPILINDKGCRESSWSPDFSKLVVSCEENNFYQLFLYTSSNHQFEKILDCEQARISCGHPSWSPDNNWIAFLYANEKSGEHPENGIYVMRPTCLDKPDLCWQGKQGPITPSPYLSWSPDGKLGAASSAFSSIEILNNTFNKIGEISISVQYGCCLDFLTWSPDGMWLAYDTTHDGISIVTKDNESTRSIFNGDGHLTGWIVIP